MPVNTLVLRVSGIKFGTSVATVIGMVRWFVAAYILIVLVISAKASAGPSLESNPTLNKFNYPTESSTRLNVQDPLPSTNHEDLRPVTLDSILENSVG